MITQPVTSNPAIVAVLARWDPRINPTPPQAREAAVAKPFCRLQDYTADELREVYRKRRTWKAAAHALRCDDARLLARARELGIDTARVPAYSDAAILEAYDRAGSIAGAGRLLGRRGGGGWFYERVKALVAKRAAT